MAVDAVLMSEDSGSDGSMSKLEAKVMKLEETMESYKKLFATLAKSVEDFLSEGSIGARMRKVEDALDTMKLAVGKDLSKVRELSAQVEADGKAIEKVASQVNTYYEAIDGLRVEMPRLRQETEASFDEHRSKIKKLIRESKNQASASQEIREQIEGVKAELERRMGEVRQDCADKIQEKDSGVAEMIEKVKRELGNAQAEAQSANEERVTKIEERQSRHSKKSKKAVKGIQSDLGKAMEAISECRQRLEEVDALKAGLEATQKLTEEHSADLNGIHEALKGLKARIDAVDAQLPRIEANEKAIGENKEEVAVLQREMKRMDRNLSKAIAESDKQRQAFQDQINISFGEVTSRVRVLMGEEKITIPELVQMNETTRKVTQESVDGMRTVVEETRKDLTGRVAAVEKGVAAKSASLKAEFDELRSDMVDAASRLNKKNKESVAVVDAKIDAEIVAVKKLVSDITGGSSYSIQNLLTHFEELDGQRKKDLSKIESDLHKVAEMDSDINGKIDKVAETAERHTRKLVTQFNGFADELDKKIKSLEEQRLENLQSLKQRISAIADSAATVKTDAANMVAEVERRCKADIAAQNSAILSSQSVALKKIDSTRAEITDEFAATVQKLNERFKKLASKVDDFQGDSGYSLPALASDIRNVSRKLHEVKEETTQKISATETRFVETVQSLQSEVQGQNQKLFDMVEQAKQASKNTAESLVQKSSARTKEYLTKCDDRIQKLSDIITQIQGGSNMSIQAIALKLVETQNGAEASVNQMKEEVRTVKDTVTTYTSQFDELVNEIKKQKGNVKSLSSSINDRISTLSASLEEAQKTAIGALKSKVHTVSDSLTAKVEEVVTNVEQMESRLNNEATSMQSDFAKLKLDMKNGIEEAKNTFRDTVEDSLKGMKQSVRQAREAIKAIKGDTEVDLSGIVKMINDLQQIVDANRDVEVQELRDMFEKVKARFKSVEQSMNDQYAKVETQVTANYQKNADYSDNVGFKIAQECKAAIKSVTAETRELKQSIADLMGGSKLSVAEVESQLKLVSDDSKLSVQKVAQNLRTVVDKFTGDIDLCQSKIAKLTKTDDSALQKSISDLQSNLNAFTEQTEATQRAVKKVLTGIQNDISSITERQQSCDDHVRCIESDLTKTIDQYIRDSEAGHDSLVKQHKALQQAFDNLETVTVSRITDKMHVLAESFNSFQAQSVEAINKVKADMHTLKRKQKTELEQCATDIASFTSNITSEIELLKKSNSSHASRLDAHFQGIKDELSDNMKQMWNKTRDMKQAMITEVNDATARANEALETSQKLYTTVLEKKHTPPPEPATPVDLKPILRQCKELIRQGNEEFSERIQRYVLQQKAEIQKEIANYSNQTAVMIENLRSELKLH